VAGTAALAAGAAWWRLGPSSGVSAAFPPRGWAVIADFENRSRDTQIDRLVQESLLLALQQSAYVNVFSRDRLFEALRRMRRPDGERVSEAVALDVCRRENAQVLLAGAIEQSGEAMRVTVRALSPSGDLLFAEIAELGRRDEFFGRIDDLARRVRRRLGETLERIQQASEPLDKVTTQSFDALRLYTQAIDRIARGRIEEAQPLLQAALTLDSQFAMAHRQLARVLQIGGERAQVLAHLERAFELRAPATTRERYLIEAAYHSVHERYDDAVESLSLLAALYPDDLDAQYELAVARSAIAEIERAIQATREVLRIEPRSPRANELVVLLLARNNQEQEALDESVRASAAIGETPRLRWGRAMALMGQRRLDEAAEELRLLEVEHAGYQGISRLYRSRIALLEGRLSDASEELTRDLEDDRRAGRASAELLRRYLLARVHLLRGATAAARDQAARIAAAPVAAAKATNLRQAAEVLLQTADATTARAVLVRLEAVAIDAPSSFTRSCVHHVTGMLALAERKAESALAAFRRADAEYGSYVSHRGMARAFELGRQWIEVAREWREVLDARGEVLRDGFSADLVEAELELGHAYVRLNQPAKAREFYQHVLEMWRRGADERLARDANQALARLPGGQFNVR
jgi:tetratricopeptide (TPR) repeat protein